MRKIILILAFVILNSSFLIHNCFSQWVQVSNGMGNNQYVISLATSGNNIFAGTYGSGVYLSTNNGQTWTQTTMNNKDVYSLAISGNNIFAGTGNGVYMSTNDGQSWTQTTLNNQSIPSLAISGNNIFAGTEYYGAYLSTNNGQNWTQTSLKNGVVSSIAINENNIFAGTGNGVYLSTNNGQNWMQSGLNNKEIHSLAINGNNIFASIWESIVYFSSDNGQNWSQTALNYVTALFLTISGNNIFAGTYEGVYLSTNNGQNWIEKNQGFNIIPSVSALLIANNYIFAGTWFYSVWCRSLSEIIGIKNISTEIPSAFSLEQNYPNPFNSVTSIKYKVTSEGCRSQKTGFRLKVYDLNGREIKTLVNDELNPGTYEVRFDAGDLPSGVYFYRMEKEKFSETKKLILLK
ncbi:MAG: T9SS type A sorting domain-containing protein [Ignavibacteria bacterium]|nr:T9SS type A sorting domain-containing protein [Ignavibacteria bacterium]